MARLWQLVRAGEVNTGGGGAVSIQTSKNAMPPDFTRCLSPAGLA